MLLLQNVMHFTNCKQISVESVECCQIKDTKPVTCPLQDLEQFSNFNHRFVLLILNKTDIAEAFSQHS